MLQCLIFSVVYVSCISMKVSETSTWLEEVGLCSIVVELYVETVQLFLAPAIASSLSNANADGFGKGA